MQELSGKTPSSGEVKDGRSQSIKDGNGDHSPLKNGGSNTNDLSKPNIAGSSSSARMNNTGELLEVIWTHTMIPSAGRGRKAEEKLVNSANAQSTTMSRRQSPTQMAQGVEVLASLRCESERWPVRVCHPLRFVNDPTGLIPHIAQFSFTLLTP